MLETTCDDHKSVNCGKVKTTSELGFFHITSSHCSSPPLIKWQKTVFSIDGRSETNCTTFH